MPLAERFLVSRDHPGPLSAPAKVEPIEGSTFVNIFQFTDPQLTKLFWSACTVEAIILGIILLVSLLTGWLSVGAMIVVIPAAVLAMTAGVFHVADARWVRIICTLVVLSPAIAAAFGPPITLLTNLLGDGVGMFWESREQSGADRFKKRGQRKLAAAIAERDFEKIKAALPGVGDINQIVNTPPAPYYAPLRETETLLSFACQRSDDSDSSLEMIRLLLAAGANPNLPPGKPLYAAVFRKPRLMELLLDAGASPNAEISPGGNLVWWSVLGTEFDPDEKKLQMMLAHGADTTRRTSDGWGAIEMAAISEGKWLTATRLAQQIPGGADYILLPGIHATLAHEVSRYKERGEAVPEAMATALKQFDAARKRAGLDPVK